MSDSINITLFPAREGDCLLLDYGPEAQKKYILIDAGRAWTYKNALKDYLTQHEINRLELLVVTHVDRDHIDGMLSLIKDSDLKLDVGDVWFNTYEHLNGETVQTPEDDELESFGAKMGEELSSEIVARGWQWNQHFKRKSVELDNCPDDKKIQVGEVNFTLLSPDREKLEALIPNWEKECQKAGITPGYQVEEYPEADDDEIEEFGAVDVEELAETEFSPDSSKPNGTSIAFILEYKGRKLLLSGDAHVDRLMDSLSEQGVSEQNPLRLDAFKLSHHGSKSNLSKELLALMDCPQYLVSTSGSYFKHPDQVAIARVVKYGSADSTINFNYKTEFNEIWDDKNWKREYQYETRYPDSDQDGFIRLEFPIE